MYFLIVKTSAIGDVIQSFPVLEYLKEKFPSCNIDWVVAPASLDLVASHPLVKRPILFDIDKKSLKNKEFEKIGKFYKALRESYYDAVFDLQGNLKSGIITFFSRARDKIGFGRKKVAEWPNLLFTNFQYNVENQLNIREQYLSLIQRYFQDSTSFSFKKRILSVDYLEKKTIDLIFESCQGNNKKILVCPGSKWKNKELDINVLKNFLSEINQNISVFYFFLWGNDREKGLAEFLHPFFKENSMVLNSLNLPTLQNFISRLDCVVAMDSCPLHLAGFAGTPTFSFFGPTLADVYKPLGDSHLSFQGSCPLNKKFQKRCPILRTCPNPGCILNVDYKKISKMFLEFVNR